VGIDARGSACITSKITATLPGVPTTSIRELAVSRLILKGKANNNTAGEVRNECVLQLTDGTRTKYD